MASFSDTGKKLSRTEWLEKELHLKQLQINRLLNITQAINNNVPAQGLFDMYRSFLSWELGVKKMALYIRQREAWTCTTYLGIGEELISIDIADRLPQFQRMKNLEETDHPLIREFDVVIPVRHKEESIAYVFIGGFSEEEDMFSKIQFITAITNVVAVAIENKRLFKRQLEQERLKKEMELAAEVQKMLIPKVLPQRKVYEFDCIYKPILSVGGDYFDFIEFSEEELLFCIGDFTGKGVSAALLMANFQANFHRILNRRPGLEELIRELNESVHQVAGGDKFITFFVAEYKVTERRLRYINAGHNPPILAGKDTVVRLNKGSIMLGPYRELPKLEVGEVSIDGEALLLSFTDGLTDVRNKAGAFLNEDALIDLVRENYHLSSGAFNKTLLKYLDDFMGAEKFPDDFTVLTGKLYCPGRKG